MDIEEQLLSIRIGINDMAIDLFNIVIDEKISDTYTIEYYNKLQSALNDLLSARTKMRL